MGVTFQYDSVVSGDIANLGMIYLIACAIGLLVWIGCLVASIIIMKRKGRSAGLGFVFGFFLGWIGLIIVLCMKKVDNNTEYDYKSNVFKN